MIDYQIAHSLPYQVYLEDDLHLKDGFISFIVNNCQRHLSISTTKTLLKMSGFSEIFMLTLAGARHMRDLFRAYGIRKGDDQTFIDPGIMDHRFVKVDCNAFGERPAIVRLRKAVNSQSPGSISTSSGITKRERYLLQKLQYCDERN